MFSWPRSLSGRSLLQLVALVIALWVSMAVGGAYPAGVLEKGILGLWHLFILFLASFHAGVIVSRTVWWIRLAAWTDRRGLGGDRAGGPGWPHLADRLGLHDLS